MPSAAKRLSAVGLLSSIASRPLPFAVRAAAVAFKVCSFISGAPVPVADLRQILTVRVDVLLVFDELGLQCPLDRKTALASLRQAVDGVHRQVETIQVVEHRHVE